MSLSDELRHDHQRLRDQLTLLEGCLPYRPPTRRAISCLVSILALNLRMHADKETRGLIHAEANSLGLSRVLRELWDVHDALRTRLAILHELLDHDDPVLEDQATMQARELIRALRQHMATEETELFARLDAGPQHPGSACDVVSSNRGGAGWR